MITIDEMQTALQSTFDTTQLSYIFKKILQKMTEQSDTAKSQQEQIEILKSKVETLETKTDICDAKIDSMKIQIEDLEKNVDILMKPKDIPPAMNLFDISAVAPKLANTRKSVRYQQAISDIDNITPVEISSSKKLRPTFFRPASAQNTGDDEFNKLNSSAKNSRPSSVSKNKSIGKVARPSSSQNNSTNDQILAENDSNSNDIAIDHSEKENIRKGSVIKSRRGSNINSRQSSSVSELPLYVTDESMNNEYIFGHPRGDSKIKSSVWSNIDPEKRNSILYELKIRGEYIKANSLLAEGNIKHLTTVCTLVKCGAYQHEEPIKLITDSFHNRIIALEEEMVICFARFGSQQQQINSLPDHIKESLFPGINLNIFQKNISKSGELFDEFDANGGVSCIISELKDYNQNVREAKSLKEEMEVRQMETDRDIQFLRDTMSNVDNKADNALIDIRTLTSIFGIPSSHVFSSPPSTKLVKDAKRKFSNTTWDSIAELCHDGETDAGFDTNDEQKQKDKEEAFKLNSLKHTVLTGLKNYILENIVDEEINPLKNTTHDLKTDMQKLENNTKMQFQQEMFTLKNQLANQDEKLKEQFYHLENNAKNGNLGDNRRNIDGGGIAEQDFAILTENVQRITVEQASAIANMINQLKRVEKSMSEKPSIDAMAEMIRLIEHTFKRQLGENVVGLKVTVGQIIKAIQNKANKDEVMKLVASRFSSMQESMEMQHDETAFTLAGSVKCISCGNAYVPGNGMSQNSSAGALLGKSRPNTTSSMLNKGPPSSGLTHSSGTGLGGTAMSVGGISRGVLTSGLTRDAFTPGAAASAGYDMDDTFELTDLDRDQFNNYTPPRQFSGKRIQTPPEAVTLSLHDTKPHLKSLLNQEKPSQPIANPLPKFSAAQRPRRGLAIAQEPLYRKARMASTLKELVKPTSAHGKTNASAGGGTLLSNTLPLQSLAIMDDETARDK